MTSVEAPVKDFIQLLREIAEASAIIRTALKDGHKFRFRNMVKLIYISMLGYPTQWAQMECLSLIHLNLFADKRAGYLALSVLLDENAEVLLLATNSIISDLSDARAPVIQLALNALGNISSETQCRAAAPVIEKLIFHKKAAVRKKAILVATRIVRKIPEMAGTFYPHIKTLINTQKQDNGAVLCIVELMLIICKHEPEHIPEYRKLIGALKKLTRARAADEYDVYNVKDPFLQVALLQILRVLGKNHPPSCEAMSSVLATVATNTDTVRNVGSAILFECVHTILGIGDADPELRVMAMNILGQFLKSSDTNVRYVALDLFTLATLQDLEVAQKYRNFIIDCLHDHDSGIRKKALVLLYPLVAAKNVKMLVRELLKVLDTADDDVKNELTQKLCLVIEKYAPSPVWYVDSLIKILNIETVIFPESVLHTLLSTIAVTPSVQAHAVQKFWVSLAQCSMENQVLLQAGLWIIGEFADVLVTLSLDGSEGGKVSQTKIVDLLNKISMSSSPSTKTKQYLLNATMKLQERFSVPEDGISEKLLSIVKRFSTSESVELQNRSIEYAVVSQLSVPTRSTLLARQELSPSLSIFAKRDASNGIDEDKAAAGVGQTKDNTVPAPAPSAPAQPVNLLGDLLGGSSGPTPATPDAPPSLLGNLSGGSDLNPSNSSLLGSLVPQTQQGPSLLGQVNGNATSLLGGAPTTESTPTPTVAPTMNLLDLAGGTSTPPPTNLATGVPAATPSATMQAGSLSLAFSFTKPNPAKPQFALISVTFTNNSMQPISDLNFQAAPPKYLKFQVSHLTATSLAPQATAGVMIKSANYKLGEKPFMMKTRITYQELGEVRLLSTPYSAPHDQTKTFENVFRDAPPGY